MPRASTGAQTLPHTCSGTPKSCEHPNFEVWVYDKKQQQFLPASSRLPHFEAMEEAVRALPDGAVQETNFQNDVLSQNEDVAPQQPRRNPNQEDRPYHTRRESHAASPPPTGSSLHGEDDMTNHSTLTNPTRSTSRALGPDLLRGFLMVLFALDHSYILKTWPLSTVRDEGGERGNGAPVHMWNHTEAYVTRLITYLCAPGLVFLFGMGIVYFGQSRRGTGWSAWGMAWHFVVRAIALTVITVLLGLVLTLGRLWFMNIALFALAIDYLLSGLLWIALVRTEEALAYGVLMILPDARDDDAREPLLADRRGEEHIAPDRKIMRAADISWHVHNAFLLIFGVITIWWNLWLSPTGGHCKPEHSTAGLGSTSDSPQGRWFGFRLWFDVIMGDRVVSLYPPLAWLSFALLGLLYGRIVIARTWTKTTLTLGNALAGLLFLAIFVLTRVLHFGNLSEGCLQMPEHKAHPNANQYLASWQSFFYLTSYPPEVALWAYGMGWNLILLALFGALPAAVTTTVLRPLIVYGTSALFFYVVHLLLLGVSQLLWSTIYGTRTYHDPWNGHGGQEVGIEWVFWLNWVVILIIMYPLCCWYDAFKRTKGTNSMWRFF